MAPIHFVIFSHDKIYQETLKLIYRFHLKFNLTQLKQCEIEGLIEEFINCVFNYNMTALLETGLKKKIIRRNLNEMNYVWHHIYTVVLYP